jgi:signal peptidase I, archaeal type
MSKIFLNIILIINIIIIILVFFIKILGFQPYVVLNNDMKPMYVEGSLMFVEIMDFHKIKENDIITYKNYDDLKVSNTRVIKIDTNNRRFFVKVDSDNTEDVKFVHFSDLLGKPAFSILYLGYIIKYFFGSAGGYIRFLIPVLFILILLNRLNKNEVSKIE